MIEYKKFIYLDMYKTGSTHVSSLLKQISTERPMITRRHAPLSSVHPFRLKGGKLVFTTVRNPWDWYVSYWAYSQTEDKSFYRHVVQAAGEAAANRLYDASRPKEAFGEWMRAIHDPDFLRRATAGNRLSSSGMAEFMGLYSYRFIRVTTPWPALFLRSLFLPTIDRAKAWQTRRALYDVAFKSETLDADFRAFVAEHGPRLGFRANALAILDKANESHKNTSSRTLASYRDYYDDALVELVARRDRLMVDLFGYDF